MRHSKPRRSVDAQEEIHSLIETFVATEHRLEELTNGDVDPLVGSDGREFVLPRAREQAQIRESNEQAEILNEMRALFDIMPAMIWFKDTHNRILLVNQAVADAAGLTIAEIEGRPSVEIYPEDAEKFFTDDLAVMQSRVPKLGYAEKVTTDGREIWVETDKIPYFDKHGTIAGIFVVARDITEKRRVHQALEQSEASMAATQRIAHLGTWEISLTDSGGIDGSVHWSDEMFRIVGYEPRSIVVTTDLFFSHVPPEDHVSMRLAVEKAIRDHTEYSMVHRIIRRDGTTRLVRATAQILFDKKTGRPLKVLGTSRDITLEQKAVDAMRESEQRFSRAFEHAPIGMALAGTDGKWLKVNWALCDLLGYSETEMLTYTTNDLTHPDDRMASAEKMRAVVAGLPGASQFEKRYVHKNGGSISVLVSLSAIRDSEGLPLYFIGQIQDITQQKFWEAALWRSRRQLRDLIDGLGPSMFLGLLTLEGILVEVNRSPLTAAGLKQEDVIGKSFVDSPWFSRLPEAQKQLREAISRGARGESSRFDLQTQGAGNDVIDVDFSMEPLRDESGKVVLLIPSARVITERKLVEKALRESEAEFRAMADAVPQIVWITRADGWNIYANRQWTDYTGLSFEQSLGQGWLTSFHPEDREQSQVGWQHAVETKSVYSSEVRMRRKDGVYRWWLVRGVPQLDALGTIVKWFGTCTDIDDLKESQGALERALKETEQRVDVRPGDMKEANSE